MPDKFSVPFVVPPGADFSTLVSLRNQNKENMEANIALAPAEHRQWAREYTREHPWAAPFIPPMAAGYAVAKLLRVPGLYNEFSTPPSLAQISQGSLGAWDGTKENLSDLLSRLQDHR
jgi:hypothetical protein